MSKWDVMSFTSALANLDFWQLFALKITLGFTLAFAIAWGVKDRSNAYRLGWQLSLLVVLVPSCVPMFQSSSVNAIGAADEFFWTMIPLLGAWLVSVAVAIEIARIVKWKE